jgi:predicted transcriptional regulator
MKRLMPSASPSPTSDARMKARRRDGAVYPQPASRWTFLTNHTHVLTLLSQYPSIVLREVAIRVGITERAVQRIIHELEQDGFIVRKKVGRQNHYQVKGNMHLRHPIEEHCSIQQLIDLVGNV